METADYGTTEMAHNAGGHNGRYLGDDTLLVKFYLHPAQDKAKTKAAGRPVFVDKEYISIMAPGNRDSKVARPARRMDIDRFPRHYEAFKKNEEVPIEGTPLTQWPAVTKAQVENLKYANIITVEQLAGAADVNLQGMMGVQHLKGLAQAYMAKSGDVKMAQKIETELATRDTKIAEQDATINEQGVMMQALEAKLMKMQAVIEGLGDDG